MKPLASPFSKQLAVIIAAKKEAGWPGWKKNPCLRSLREAKIQPNSNQGKSS